MTTGQQNTITINVQANTQQAQQQVTQLQSGVQNVGNAAQQTAQRTETAFEKLKKKIKETLTSVSGLQGVFETIMGGAVIKSMGEAIKSVESLSNQLSVLRQNAKFEGIAQDFEDISQITGGLANQFDMVGGVSRALAFNIDLSGGKLKELIEVAQKTAIVMGTDLKTAFDDLITGVSRGSVPILDNLGIVISLEDANQKFAQSLGKATDQMTKAEKTTALLNEVITKLKENTANVDLTQLEQSGTKAVKIMEDALQQAKKSIVNTFVDMGMTIGEGFANATSSSEEKLNNYIADLRAKREADFKKQFGDLIKWMESQTNRFKTGIIDGENEQISSAQNLANQFDFNRFKTDEELDAEAEKKKQNKFKKIQKKYDDTQDLIKKNNEKIAKLNSETAAIWLKSEEFGMSEIEKLQNKINNIQEQKKKLGSDKVGQAELEKLKADEFLLNQELAKAEIKLEREKQLEKQKAIKETYDIDNELSQQKKDYEQKLRDEDKKARDNDLKEKEKYFNMFQSLASQSIDAIFEGNADAFLENLLNFANSFGTTLIMDGIKTLWMGNAQNALFPGLGASATAVGASEIAIGTAMKAGAYLGGSFSGGTSSSEGSSATEKSQSNQPLVLNVTTSLFGSEKQARKELNGLMRG